MLSDFNCQMDEEGICVCNDAFWTVVQKDPGIGRW